VGLQVPQGMHACQLNRRSQNGADATACQLDSRQCMMDP
jgi:hypothetical protein